MNGQWIKKHRNDVIWWWDDFECYGTMKFTFDKNEIFNYWSDYPSKLTAEQKKIFDKENVYWAKFKG